jgi:hypothetical protein
MAGCLSHGRRKAVALAPGFNKVLAYSSISASKDQSAHAVWGVREGKHKTNDLYIGNVYLPHTGRTKEFIANARAALADDVAHYQQKATSSS